MALDSCGHAGPPHACPAGRSRRGLKKNVFHTSKELFRKLSPGLCLILLTRAQGQVSCREGQKWDLDFGPVNTQGCVTKTRRLAIASGQQVLQHRTHAGSLDGLWKTFTFTLTPYEEQRKPAACSKPCPRHFFWVIVDPVTTPIFLHMPHSGVRQ
jgi:hypothetical protein